MKGKNENVFRQSGQEESPRRYAADNMRPTTSDDFSTGQDVNKYVDDEKDLDIQVSVEEQVLVDSNSQRLRRGWLSLQETPCTVSRMIGRLRGDNNNKRCHLGR